MTFLDGSLAIGTAIGLLFNALWDWWWADPAAALLVALVAANEAQENWQEARELGVGRSLCSRSPLRPVTG